MDTIVRARTPTPSGMFAQSPLRLPPTMVERAARRLCWIALACAVTAVVSFLLHRTLQPEVAEAQRNPALPLMALFIVLVSAGMIAVQRFRLLAPSTILNLGLAFEIVAAFVISFFETSVQLHADRAVHGTSMVAVWILAVGLVIPNTPVVKLLTAMGAAATWPLAYTLNLYWNDFDPLPWNRLAVWMFGPSVVAFWTYFMAKRIYQMEIAEQRAEELGSYQLDYLIGSGGMGEVWRARHRMLARDAAIKLIRPELLAMQSGRQAEVTRRRFEREARVTASLQCPHTVYLFDFGTTQQGVFYYVMELLDGISLQVLVDRFGPQPAARVRNILRQACESLEEAHRRGLVHRDVKPSNIFICKVGLRCDFVKVLDFGLVKQTAPDEGTHLTLDGFAAGTPAYMAPEVALGDEHLDGRVDVYSLGCVAYFLLTGQPVFAEPTPTATALAHVQKEPLPPSQRSEVAIPPSLEQVVMRCLAKKPDERPRSAQELRRLLDACTDCGEWTEEQSAEWWALHLPETRERSADKTPLPRPVAVSGDD